MTDKQTFKDIENWLEEVEKHADDNVVKLLVGNKSDLENERQVTKAEGQEYADTLGVKFMETSAKESLNVEEAFVAMTKEIKKRAKVIDDDESTTTAGESRSRRHLTTTAVTTGKAKKKGCC